MIQWMRPHGARPPLSAIAAVACMTLLADVRPAGAQSPFELYRERAAMLAVGERCRLFDADTIAALAAGASQARTAALRAGTDNDTLDRGAAQAKLQVANLACAAPIVRQEAQRVKSAFAVYSGLHRMSFPGDVAGWRADRTLAVHNASWMLAQEAFAGQDKVVFGLAGREGEQAVTVAVSDPEGLQPYAARILLRDCVREPQPYIAGGRPPLAARAPVRAAARAILADAKAPADRALLPVGVASATAFRFPPNTLDALQHLDPREAISVEFLYPSERGDVVRTAFLEVGDFNAGMAFLKMGPK